MESSTGTGMILLYIEENFCNVNLFSELKLQSFVDAFPKQENHSNCRKEHKKTGKGRTSEMNLREKVEKDQILF